MKIKKAIIPCAGIGTRFLPSTKAIPKELFPVIDKPITQLIVEELSASGVLKVIFVINQEKESIRRYFNKDKKLEKFLKDKGKKDLLQTVSSIPKMAKFSFVYQNKPLGNGHAVLVAEKEIGREPFFVNWADDLIIGHPVPYFSQLSRVYQKYQGIILSVVKTDSEGQRRYGIIKPRPIGKNIYQVLSVIEKPGPQKAPSNLAHIGGFVLTPKIFKYLRGLKPGKGGEIWLQDAINEISKKEPVYALEFNGEYFDVGEKVGYLKTIVKMALKREDTKEPFKKFLKEIKI